MSVHDETGARRGKTKVNRREPSKLHPSSPSETERNKTKSENSPEGSTRRRIVGCNSLGPIMKGKENLLGGVPIVRKRKKSKDTYIGGTTGQNCKGMSVKAANGRGNPAMITAEAEEKGLAL